MTRANTRKLDNVQQAVLNKVENSKEAQKLRDKYYKLLREGNIIKANNVKKQLLSYIHTETEREIERLNNQLISIKEVEGSLQPESQRKFRESMDVMCFMIDIMDTCIRNMNEAIQTRNSETQVIAFDKLNKVGKEVKQLMSHFKAESDEHNELWCDTLDSIEAYLYKRAAAYHKKSELLTYKQKKQK